LSLNVACLFLVCATLCTASGVPQLIEPNRGQFPAHVLYASDTGGAITALTSEGLEFRYAGKTIVVRFNGASFSHCGPDFARQSTTNYLNLRPAISGVPAYASIVCHEIYPGIDWRLRLTERGLEHDWYVAASADPARIKLTFSRNVRADVDSNGALVLSSGVAKIIWRKPVASQDTKKGVGQVEATYALIGQNISLNIGNYHRDRPLTIDPVIDFSYVINGDGDDAAYQVGLDSSGNIYLAGLTVAPDFQTTPGAVSTKPAQYSGVQFNLWVRKLSPDTSKLIYSTYVTLTSSFAMSVDAAGDVYLAAYGSSVPSGGTTLAANGDVTVYKLAPDGSNFVCSALLLPGDDVFSNSIGLAIDAGGDAYVGAGSGHAYVAKVDPTGTKQLFLFSTPISGGVAGIGLGSDSSVYVAGSTSQGFTATAGSLNPSIMNPQNQHGYLLRVKPDGSGMVFATWIGGQDTDTVTSLVIDSTGNAVVGGQTSSTTQYPGLQGALLGIAAPAKTAAFVTKINASGSTALFTDLVPGLSVGALAIDGMDNAYASGPTNTYFSVGQTSAVGVTAMKINPSGQALLYNLAIPTVNGTSSSTSPTYTALAVDGSGALYLAGTSASLHVPEPADVIGLFPSAFLLKIDPNPDQCDLELVAQPPGPPPLAEQPVTLNFTIFNHGPADAEDVVFLSPNTELQMGGQVFYCAVTGTGICDLNSSFPRVWFPTIPTGASEQVQFQITPFIAATENIQMAASVYTSTSELNIANNSATAVNTINYVALNITSFIAGLGSNINIPYAVSGNATPAILPSPGFSFSAPVYALPNSQVTITWTTPYVLQNFGGFTVEFTGWSDGNTDNPRTFNIGTTAISVQGLFQIFMTPYLTTAGVVNAASYAASGVSPGEIVTLFGFNLGNIASAQITNGVFSTSIGNVSLTFDGHPAPLIYTSGTQTAAVVPWEIAGQTSTELDFQVGSNSTTLTIPVVPAVPALFTAGSTGMNQAAALDQDGSVNSSANPAHPGDVIVLYGTGEGIVSPVPEDGAIAPSQAPLPKLSIAVTIGGLPAQINYAGEAPGLISGVIQINAVIPSTISPGSQVPVTWSAGTYSSQQGVTIAVQ
jgi:uncharacterized protein (TIGR03437 family)